MLIYESLFQVPVVKSGGAYLFDEFLSYFNAFNMGCGSLRVVLVTTSGRKFGIFGRAKCLKDCCNGTFSCCLKLFDIFKAIWIEVFKIIVVVMFRVMCRIRIMMRGSEEGI